MSAWADVFPEVSDPSVLSALLHRIDHETGLPLPGLPLPGLPLPAPPPVVRGRIADTDDALFGEIVAALLADLLDDAGTRLRRIGLLADPAPVVTAVQAHAVQLGSALVARSLLGRLAGARRAGRLPGESPEQRFDAFVADSRSTPGLARLSRELPETVAWVRAVVRLRLDAVVEMLVDTERHWSAVAGAVLGVHAGDRVVACDLGAGDTHGRGRSVAVLTLDSGARLVVKPRSLLVEQGFGSFASWLGARVDVEVPRLTSLTRGDRGWVEHAGPGTAPPAASYLRVGGTLLAALHLLDATDIHYENLLTDRRGLPVVVDAETVLTPRIEGTDRPDDGLLGVVATGMLSLRREQTAPGKDETGEDETGEDERGEVDAGALGYRPGARSPFRTWSVVHPGRDDLRLEMAAVQVDHPGPASGAATRTGADREALVAGFTDAMQWVLAHRGPTLERIERAFPGGTVRHIQRPTMLYAQVQRMATHPRFATDRDRRRVFGRLAVLAPETPWPLVAAEVAQLAVGDLPSFQVPVRGTTVLDGHGTDTGARCRRTPLARCLEAVRRLDEADATREADAVQTSLSAWSSTGTTA